MAISARNNLECPFCSVPKGKILVESEFFILRYDEYPVSNGHVLVIPKRHITSLFDLTEQEFLDLHHFIQRARVLSYQIYDPDGFNIGVNDGSAAGQTIEHLHIHIIPRYVGDVEHPAGGIRHLMPNKVEYPVMQNHNGRQAQITTSSNQR